MNKYPYAIYTQNRPMRIAFLIDKNSPRTLSHVKSIMKYNHDKWGGRNNPIILTEGREFDEIWSNMLYEFDPDLIKAPGGVSRYVIEEIDRKIHPYLFDANITKGNTISVDDEPAHISVTPENIRSFSVLNHDTKLVRFKFKKNVPAYIKDFILYNFGEWSYNYQEDLFSKYETVNFDITNIKDLKNALDTLGTFGKRFLFPIQLCSLWGDMNDVEYNSDTEKFHVFVGDDLEDIVSHWNRNFQIQNWQRIQISSLWVPNKLAEKFEIAEDLGTFINKYSHNISNNHPRIVFESFSDKKMLLESFVKKCKTKIHVPVETRKLKIVKPNIRPYNFYQPTAEMQVFTGYHDKEQLSIIEPKREKGIVGGHWMTDVYIEFRPERYENIISDTKYLWKLPHNNTLAPSIFGKVSRTQRNGYFSVLMSGNSIFDRTNNLLISYKLPSDISIIRYLLLDHRRNYYIKDSRKNIKRKRFEDVEISSNGKYFQGILNVFGSLDNAYDVIEQKYWRDIFDIMTNKQKVAKYIDSTLENKLRKKRGILSSSNFEAEMADFVIEQCTSITSIENIIAFSVLEEKAKEVYEAFNRGKQKGQRIEYSDLDLKHALNHLISLGVVLQGINPACGNCGQKNWYSVEKMDAIMLCPGCNHSIQLRAEEAWYYKLNRLVSEGFARQGLVPLTLTLGQIKRHDYSCFVYVPSINIYKNRKDSLPITDLDICCISEGQFIIGEVKNRAKKISEKNIKYLKEVAIQVRADKIIFSALDKPSKQLLEKINNLNDDLKPYGIKAEWYKHLESFYNRAYPPH